MVLVSFVLSVVATSVVMSFVGVEAGSSDAGQPDYHFVPYAGDVFGA